MRIRALDIRKVQKKVNLKWVDIDFKDIKKGDIFRMFKSTGEPVVGDKNDTMFEVISDAYISEDGEYQVEIK